MHGFMVPVPSREFPAPSFRRAGTTGRRSGGSVEAPPASRPCPPRPQRDPGPVPQQAHARQSGSGLQTLHRPPAEGQQGGFGQPGPGGSAQPELGVRSDHARQRSLPAGASGFSHVAALEASRGGLDDDDEEACLDDLDVEQLISQTELQRRQQAPSLPGRPSGEGQQQQQEQPGCQASVPVTLRPAPSSSQSSGDGSGAGVRGLGDGQSAGGVATDPGTGAVPREAPAAMPPAALATRLAEVSTALARGAERMLDAEDDAGALAHIMAEMRRLREEKQRLTAALAAGGGGPGAGDSEPNPQGAGDAWQQGLPPQRCSRPSEIAAGVGGLAPGWGGGLGARADSRGAGAFRAGPAPAPCHDHREVPPEAGKPAPLGRDGAWARAGAGGGSWSGDCDPAVPRHAAWDGGGQGPSSWGGSSCGGGQGQGPSTWGGGSYGDGLGETGPPRPAWTPDKGQLSRAAAERVDATRDPAWQRQDYPWSGELRSLNASRFGNPGFRCGQLGIMNASLSGRDVFVLMPTGGGKSLCYQLPALLTPGVTVVVSPLVSLIQDQVHHLGVLGIPALCLGGAAAWEAQRAVFDELVADPEASRVRTGEGVF